MREGKEGKEGRKEGGEVEGGREGGKEGRQGRKEAGEGMGWVYIIHSFIWHVVLVCCIGQSCILPYPTIQHKTSNTNKSEPPPPKKKPPQKKESSPRLPYLTQSRQIYHEQYRT